MHKTMRNDHDTKGTIPEGGLNKKKTIWRAFFYSNLPGDGPLRVVLVAHCFVHVAPCDVVVANSFVHVAEFTCSVACSFPHHDVGHRAVACSLVSIAFRHGACTCSFDEVAFRDLALACSFVAIAFVILLWLMVSCVLGWRSGPGRFE